jgi:FkbM family methyltransferase
MTGLQVVWKTLGGRTFQVLDPASYPHGNNCFDEVEPILEAWSQFGEGHTVIDVGACFGTYTMPALAAGARVIAFEPSDDGFRILHLNVAINRWTEKFHGRKVAVFDGEARYPEALHESVFSRSYPAKDIRYSSMDAELGDSGRIDCIKIDVEGGELGVLRGAKTLLRRDHPLLLIEDHQGMSGGNIVSDYPESIGSREAIVQLLTECGYRTIERTPYFQRGYIVARA